MTDSPELSVSPPAESHFVAERVDDDPTADPSGSSSARPRRRSKSPADGLMPVPALRMQQSLDMTNVVARHLQQFQQAAETANAYRARVTEITAPISTLVNSAAFAKGIATLTAPGGVFDTANQLARIFEQPVAAQAAMQAAKMVELSRASAVELTTSIVEVQPPLVTVPPVTSAFAGQLAEFSKWKPQLEQALKSVASVSRWVADFGPSWAEFGRQAELARQAVAAARMFRERLFLAVLAAQDAAMRGDLDRVAAFFDECIELPRSNRNARLQAGIDVLLLLDLTQFGPETAFELVEQIEKETNRHFRRGRRLLADTELNHVSVASLEALPAILGEERAAGILPKAPSAETVVIAALNIFDDVRLAIVVGDLPPVEAQVAIARASTRSWTEAAIICGYSPADAKNVSERVRGKVKRRVGLMQAQGQGPSRLLGGR